MPSNDPLHPTRRQFLVGSVGTGVLLAFATPSTVLGARRRLAAEAFEPTVWFRIAPDGHVQMNIARSEMGQHVGTALARLMAEELEVAWDDVGIFHVATDPKWGTMITGGSWSVHTSFFELSRAGAAGRIALVEAGAKMLGAGPGDCRAEASRVHHGERSVSYAEIVGEGRIDRVFGAEELARLPLKAPRDYRVLGSPGTALDVPAKTDGTAKFGIDYGVPGMVHARPVLPPTRYGSRVESLDDTAARRVPGYRETLVLEDPSGTCQGWLAVLADSTAATFRAADALDVTWAPGPRADVDEAAMLAEGLRLVGDPASGGGLWVREGDVDAAFAEAAQTVEATYTTRGVLHFQLEPLNAVVFEEDGHWHFHSGNQWQTLTLPLLAKALAVPEDRVTIHHHLLGGGFGRRLLGDYMVPAALAAKAIGAPVKMVFTRPDDVRFDCPRSPTVQKVRTAVDAEGHVTACDHTAAAGWPSSAMAPALVVNAVEGGGKAPGFAINGADHWYGIPNQRVRAIRNDVVQETILPGWLRSVGPGYTAWALEQQIDEVAHATGQDPLALRLSLLDAQGRNAGEAPASTGGAARLAAVLQRAAERARWDERVDLPADTALGVAVSTGQERAMPTWVATVAQVHVDRGSGVVTVQKLTTVVDAGTIVHPDGAMAQLEGGTLWGLSMALYEATSFADGQTTDRNLDTYTPLRIDQVPELDLSFVESDEMPVGLGEPGVIAVAPAIANAVFAAVGARVRDLPIRPEAVKAALPA